MMAPTTNNVAMIQLNQLPSQDKGVRHVAFTETLPKHHATSNDGNYEDKRRCRPRLFACCAWTCVGVFGIVLALLIIGVIFMSFLQSSLPEISIENLELSKFEVINSRDGNMNEALLNAQVEISMEMRSKNEKVELSYSNITVKVASEDVKLGKSEIVGFSHKPKNTTYLKVTTRVVREVVDRENALEVKEERENVEMVVEVTMEGSIGFQIGILRIKKVPIMVGCQVQQFLLVNRVKEPLCSIRMFPTR